MRTSFLPASAATLAASLWMSACGGGGGDAPPAVRMPTELRSLPASAGSDIDASNYADRAATTIETVLTSASGGNPLEQPLALQPGVAARAAHPEVSRPAALVHWGLRQAAQAAARDATREQVLAVRTRTEPCGANGSVDVTLDDADDDRQLSSGDTITMQFSACVFVTGEPAANGSVAMRINAIELDAAAEPTAIDASLTFGDFSVAGLGRMSGDARLWSVPIDGGEHSLLRYSAMRASFATRTVTLNFDLDQRLVGTALTTRVNGALTLAGQAYKLVQAGSFAGVAGGLPASGTLRVLDANADRVDIIARGSLVDRDYYPRAASTPAATERGTPWSDFSTP